MNEICMIGEHEYIFITKRFKICKKCGLMLKSTISFENHDFGRTVWNRIDTFDEWFMRLQIDIENENMERKEQLEKDKERDKALKWLGEK